MMVLWLLLTALLSAVNSGPAVLLDSGKLRGSQFPRQDVSIRMASAHAGPADPRVQVQARNNWGASHREAKTSGFSASFTMTKARKRAFQRAQARAGKQGGTWYRGQWRTARSLGVVLEPNVAGPTRPPTATHVHMASQGRFPRLRIVSYNVGGMSAELYDTFVSWLAAQNSVDVVVLQETHWGLGRTANTWSTGGWHFISSPSSDTRYAGVCICVNSRVAGAEDLDYRVLCPGRLLHVRIHNPRQDTSVDVVGLYQWVPQSRAPEGNLANRHRLWMQLGQLLGTLPKRNVLLLAGDFNSTCCRLDVHVGSGVLASSRKPDEDLLNLIRTHDLCLLNTWSSARPRVCATFVNGSMRSQIGFIVTRRGITDPQARRSQPFSLDLSPWRLGAKHRPVWGSVPWIGGWRFQRRLAHTHPAYSLPTLRACASDDPAAWHTFCTHVRQVVSAASTVPSVSWLHQTVLQACRRFFPPNKPKACSLNRFR